MSTIRTLLAVIALGLIALVTLALTLANRQPVRVVIDPVGGTGAAAVDIPLYLLLFGVMLGGVVIGGVAAWLSQGKWRRIAHARARDVQGLNREIERLNRHLRIVEARDVTPQHAPVERVMFH